MRMRGNGWPVAGLILLVLGAAIYAVSRAGGAGNEEVRATMDLAEAMGAADTTGYALALEPREFVFPSDHGPHPDFRTEWWYVTANLDGVDGRRFGVQFTLFRSALAPRRADLALSEGDGLGVPSAGTDAGQGEASPWSTRQVYMGHLAVTDVRGDAFHEAERFTRGSTGLAGGTSDPLRIWMDDWSLRGGGEVDPDAPTAGPVFPLTVRADADPVAVQLELSPARPLVLQGERGLSQKGPEPGNASFYYSFTRLQASGTVTVDGVRHPVTGSAWLDREWSTSALADDQAGWDWFSLQLDSGDDLMFYQLRRKDGATDPLSEGVRVLQDGTALRLEAGDFVLTELGRWRSPLDGTVYPSGWRIQVPDEGLDLEVIPVRQDQELNVSVRYWEGAVDVRGTGASEGVVGRGYVELTGYSPDAEPGREVGSARFKPSG
jgi:predicted secreted hydrolase